METEDMRGIPRHIAIIMDGNGRWAGKRRLKRIMGHKRGIEVARVIVEECCRMGVGYLTLYAFSKENWERPSIEVDALMKLLELYLRNETKAMMEDDIVFRVIGNRVDLPSGVGRVVNAVEEKTRDNSGMVLQMALSYSGRAELVDAAKGIVEDVISGVINPDSINEDIFRGHLYAPDIPDPDLLIRTSGEMRVSNFLLWQIAYAEIYVTSVLWPDFGKGDLLKAINDFNRRERRFGLTGEQLLMEEVN